MFKIYEKYLIKNFLGKFFLISILPASFLISGCSPKVACNYASEEAKIPLINTKLITVTEVRMTPDLKTARVYVIPLGGIDMKENVKILTEYSHLVRKALSKRLDIKFLPKLTFVEDNSFEYAEKIEKIIKKNKDYDKEKKRYN